MLCLEPMAAEVGKKPAFGFSSTQTLGLVAVQFAGTCTGSIDASCSNVPLSALLSTCC